MKGVRSVLVVAVAVLASACAWQGNVDVYKAPDAELAARQTFHWKGGDFATARHLDATAIASADAQVRAAVVAELTRRGYVETPEAAGADLAVSFQVSGVRRFDTIEPPRVGAPSPNQVLTPGQIRPPPASTVAREVSVREGSVILMISDAASGKLLWRGQSTAESRTSNSERAARTVAQMAREIAMEVPRHSR